MYKNAFRTLNDIQMNVHMLTCSENIRMLGSHRVRIGMQGLSSLV